MSVTGRCHCGQVRLSASTDPLVVAYCHCTDCRRWTGSPLPAFAAFSNDSVTLDPPVSEQEHNSGVHRSHCPGCGTPLTARFSYIPGQIYLPLGILDRAENFAPALHCHADKALNWLCISDDLPRHTGSARDSLTAAK